LLFVFQKIVSIQISNTIVFENCSCRKQYIDQKHDQNWYRFDEVMKDPKLLLLAQGID